MSWLCYGKGHGISTSPFLFLTSSGFVTDYPVHTCAAGIKSFFCRHTHTHTHTRTRTRFKNASSRVAMHLKMLNSMKNNQRNHIGTFMYLTQVGSSFRCYFSYFLLSVSWLHPFRNHTWYYGQPINYAHAKLQAYPELIWHVWQCVHNAG